MKKMVLVTLVILMGQFSFAARSEAEIAKKASPAINLVERVKADAKGDIEAFKKNPLIKDQLVKALNSIISEAHAGKTENFLILLHLGNAKDVLTKITELSMIHRDATSTEVEKKQAEKALDLLALSANGMDVLVKNSTEGLERAKNVKLAVEVSDKVAGFADYKSERAKKYAEVYERALTENKSVHDALADANVESKQAITDAKTRETAKEITEDDVLNCSKGMI